MSIFLLLISLCVELNEKIQQKRTTAQHKRRHLQYYIELESVHIRT